VLEETCCDTKLRKPQAGGGQFGMCELPQVGCAGRNDV
jgi:hypothetical protein